MVQYETIEITREGHLTWLALDRPDALNALSMRLVDELRDFFTNLVDDTETRVLVVRGKGRAFCAGLDLKEDRSGASSAGIAGRLRGQRHIAEIPILMRRAPQPIIAAVHGAAAGGGFAIALAADVRIAGRSARMNAAFIRLGLSACDVGVSYFLPRLVGASVASELLLTGDFIDAERALATGLVSRVVPDAELEGAARELAGRMLRNSPLALRLTKECLKVNIDAAGLDAAIAIEDRNQVLASSSADFREGVAAFLEKREPKFQDR
ncbi:MAG TPA: enoyl-CoA hydratase-related protein [Myxococcota bacterium]|nr:enoyl-CoA hydratase-related protein [Myxococcota bacterium]